MARSDRTFWPVSEDHCFQRIVLDNVCGGVWYEHLDRPAYKHLTKDQAQRAVEICRDIADGRVRSQTAKPTIPDLAWEALTAELWRFAS